MKSLRWLDRRAAYIVGSLAILLGVMAPAAFPMFASAASLQNRSIEMSSSIPGDTSVSYKLTMDVSSNIDHADGGVIIQFCDSSSTPIIGTTCTAPTGFSVSGVTTTGSTTAGAATAINSNSGIQWVPTADVTAPTTISMTFNGLTNPSTANGTTFYARITTYTNNLTDYTSPTSVGTYADYGGVALATVTEIGITAYVQESLAFCVANTTPTSGCGGLTYPTDNPSMTLGEQIGSSNQKALSSSAVSTGLDYAQVNTNASHGVVVNLHSDATDCGGLIRKNDGTNCDIGPASSGITAGQAKFGLKLGTPVAASGGTTHGSYTPVSNYSDYYMDFVAGNATGVTSTYGSELFSAAGPTSNWNMPLTFGASVSDQTPAGIYAANLNLIATGTF